MALRGWRECTEAGAALRPERLADGVSAEERKEILRECREARDWLDKVVRALE